MYSTDIYNVVVCSIGLSDSKPEMVGPGQEGLESLLVAQSRVEKMRQKNRRVRVVCGSSFVQ